MSAKRPGPTKKPYARPRLTVYGDLRRLTRAKSGISSDSGGNPKSKFGGKA